MNPMFSIIVPVYNVEDYVEETLNSVLSQGGDDWECICVDDGSTDNSGTILDSYKVLNTGFKIIHQANSGVSAARNAALAVAKGEWIIFLDADDVLHAKTLQFCREAIRKFPEADAVQWERCDFEESHWSHANDSVCNAVVIKDISKYIDPEAYMWQLWLLCYKRSLVHGLEFRTDIKYGMGEDRTYLGAALDKGRIVVQTKSPLYGYRRRMGSATFSVRTAEKQMYLSRYYCAWLDQIQNSEKCYAKNILRGLGLSFTQGYAVWYFRTDLNEREKGWQVWVDMMAQARQYEFIGWYWRAKMQVLCKVKSKTLAWLLCYLPFWLKTHGFHRPKMFR